MSTDEDRIIAVLKNGDGIHSTELKNLIKDGPVDQVVNKLLQDKMVEMAQAPGGGFILRIPKGTQLTNSTPEEQLVFSLIEESGSKGIWIKEIREKSGLTETQMKRVLKTLEKQKMVKAIKAVGTTRKCYMLYSLDADESISGGIFYSNQEVDSSFIKTLIDVSVGFLQKKYKQAFAENGSKLEALRASCIHVSEVTEYIRETKICTVNLTDEDVEHILELAWKRNRIYKQDQQGYYRYRAVHPGVDGTTFAICNFCPVRSECRVGYKISPETCVYFDAIKNVDLAETTLDDLEYDSDF